MDIPLYEQIFNHLFQKIKIGELKPGERIPSEKQLADQFHVSRITSKKALELLVQHRLIDRIQGRGSFVTEFVPDLQDIKLQSNADEDHNGNSNSEIWRTIGVILPDFADCFGADLIRGIEEMSLRNHCHMLLKLTYGNREEEEVAIRSFITSGIDGIIVFPGHGEHYNAELLRLVLNRFPIVFVDRYLKGIAATAVFTDNRKASFDLTDMLLAKGARHIGFLSPPADFTSTIEDRLAGFNDACNQRGWTPKPEHIMTNLFSTLPSFDTPNVQSDIETVRRYVEMNPELTAFVVSEYNLALILKETLLSMDKRIPEHYQIVCFDSPIEPCGTYLFTHVRQNQREMGRKAVQLISMMWNDEKTSLFNIVTHDIIVGQSTEEPIIMKT